MPEKKDIEKENWHALPAQKALERLGSEEKGLSKEDARRRLREHGRNVLEEEKGTNPLKLVLEQVRNPLIYLLAAAALVSMFVSRYLDAAVIFGVVIINTALGVVQQWRAERALEALHKMAAPHARVLREGREEEIEAREAVPGDIIVLEAGDRVPADARLLESRELQVNESSLTGEFEPVGKDPGEVKEDTPLAERGDMVWMSTSVTSGTGRAVIVATGMRTEMGRIAGQVKRAEREKTPLQRRMEKLGIYIGLGGTGLAAAVFALGVYKGYGTVEMLLFSIAMAVSAIPEGLPAVISITLALGVQRMAGRNAIVRRLPAVETLGSTTVICSDKTGTITKNEMTVTRLWAGGRAWEVSGQGYAPEGEIRPSGKDEDKTPDEKIPESLRDLLFTGCHANDSKLVQEEGSWRVEGDPTEGALLVAARKAGLNCEKVRGEHTRADEIPFESEEKYMAVLVSEENEARLYVKGAVERILDFSSHIELDGETREMNDSRREKVNRAAQSFAGDALRVLAGAWKKMPQGAGKAVRRDAEEGLVFAGLWGMLDPPRPEALEAIKKAKQAGIRVIMLTGDNPVTAAAISKMAGIAPEEESEAVTGPFLEKMSGEELSERVMHAHVFARVSPSHKMKIMESLKKKGQIVGMTGDGVNDAPALKGADIGIAMGKTGTEVAREAADMILLDDDFATIVNAIEEGRVIFGNLRRVIYFMVATSITEIFTLSTALMLGYQLPLTAVMILWINLVTDGAANVPLGIEPKHADVLRRKPRPPDSGIMDKVMIRRGLILSVIGAGGTLWLFSCALDSGDIWYARTVAFTTLAAFQWFQGLNARSRYYSVFKIGLFSNRWLFLGIGLAVLLQLAVIYTGAGQALFGTRPLGINDWLFIIPVASTIFIADELMKLIHLHGRPPGTGSD